MRFVHDFETSFTEIAEIGKHYYKDLYVRASRKRINSLSYDHSVLQFLFLLHTLSVL